MALLHGPPGKGGGGGGVWRCRPLLGTTLVSEIPCAWRGRKGPLAHPQTPGWKKGPRQNLHAETPQPALGQGGDMRTRAHFSNTLACHLTGPLQAGGGRPGLPYLFSAGSRSRGYFKSPLRCAHIPAGLGAGGRAQGDRRSPASEGRWGGRDGGVPLRWTPLFGGWIAHTGLAGLQGWVHTDGQR